MKQETEDSLRPLRRKLNIFTGATLCYLVATIIGLIFIFLELSMVESYSQGNISLVDLEKFEKAYTVGAMIELITYLFWFIMFLVWFHTAFWNARVIAKREDEKTWTTPGWSIAHFFIPIVSLWWPYKSAREIKKYFSSSYNYIGVWWTLWVATSILARSASAMYTASTATAISDPFNMIYIGYYILEIIFVITTFIMVKYLTESFAKKNHEDSQSHGIKPMTNIKSNESSQSSSFYR